VLFGQWQLHNYEIVPPKCFAEFDGDEIDFQDVQSVTKHNYEVAIDQTTPSIEEEDEQNHKKYNEKHGIHFPDNETTSRSIEPRRNANEKEGRMSTMYFRRNAILM
jgi:hypothetical protein